MTVTIKDNQVEVVEEHLPEGITLDEAWTFAREHDELVHVYSYPGYGECYYVQNQECGPTVGHDYGIGHFFVRRNAKHPDVLAAERQARYRASLPHKRREYQKQIAALQERIASIEEEMLTLDEEIRHCA